MKNVQISYELFVKLLLYHLAEDYDDTEEIAKGLQDKLDSMIRHQHYTEYKTAETEEEKQAARQKYLLSDQYWCKHFKTESSGAFYSGF